MIDFTKFTKVQRVTVPVVNGDFQYNRKKYTLPTPVTGWYIVIISGNSACIGEEAYIIEPDVVNNRVVLGYSYNNNMIFQNFDVGRRKTGADMMCPLLFNDMVDTFTAVRAVLWEDRKIYFLEVNYGDDLVHRVKSLYDEEKGIHGEKFITPEMKTLYLFHDLERQNVRRIQEEIRKQQEAVLKEEDRKRREEEFKKTLPGRLAIIFTTVGATMRGYSVSGKRVTVIWKLDSTGTEFNSVIDVDSFRVLEAGYCMSGSDKDHSISSMVLLAEDYEKDDLIYITRR